MSLEWRTTEKARISNENSAPVLSVPSEFKHRITVGIIASQYYCRRDVEMIWILASHMLGRTGCSGFLANKKNTPLIEPKAPNINQAIM